MAQENTDERIEGLFWLELEMEFRASAIRKALVTYKLPATKVNAEAVLAGLEHIYQANFVEVFRKVCLINMFETCKDGFGVNLGGG